VQDGIRELIANAIDASRDQVGVFWDGQMGVIKDQGEGLSKRALLVGYSDKGDSQIGQFGEGMKIAALVLAREGRLVAIESKSTCLRFAVEESPEYEDKVLVAYEEGLSVPVSGTMVRVGCTQEELEEAKGCFLLFKETRRVRVDAGELPSYVLPDEPARIFVLGVFVGEAETLFGYDLSHKSLMNRDRTILDQNALREAIRQVLARLEDRELLERVLASCQGDRYLEHDCWFYPANQGLWKESIGRVFGKKVCIGISVSPALVSLASQRGWNVLTDLVNSL
jgi:hypothetical protein